MCSMAAEHIPSFQNLSWHGDTDRWETDTGADEERSWRDEFAKTKENGNKVTSCPQRPRIAMDCDNFRINSSFPFNSVILSSHSVSHSLLPQYCWFELLLEWWNQ